MSPILMFYYNAYKGSKTMAQKLRVMIRASEAHQALPDRDYDLLLELVLTHDEAIEA